MENETCQHLFLQGGPGSACAKCGASLMTVQTQTPRPSPREELHNKLLELDQKEGEKEPAPQVESASGLQASPTPGLMRAIRVMAVTREEHKQTIRELYDALHNAVEALEAKLKAHVEERLLAPESEPPPEEPKT